MSIEKRLTEEIKNAMKGGNRQRLMALRALKSVLTNERTRHSGEMSENQEIKVIASYRKKMAGALEQYRDAERDDLARQAEMEIAVCDALLPEKLSGDELKRMVEQAIADAGAASPSDLGKVMGPLMKELAGRADGNEVRRLVMERLGG